MWLKSTIKILYILLIPRFGINGEFEILGREWNGCLAIQKDLTLVWCLATNTSMIIKSVTLFLDS